MSMLVLLLSFIASALADYATDLKINQTYIGFIQHFERFVQKTTDQAVFEAYEAQIKDGESSERYSLEEIQQASSNITLPVIYEFRPIAYKIIHDAGYNRKGNYYIYDNRTENWHLPYREAPVNPINGTLVNSQILGQELQNAFLQLMSTKNSNSKLQKRLFGLERVFTSVKTASFIKNTKSSSPDEVLNQISFFRKFHSDLSPADLQSLSALEKNAEKQINWRKSASHELQQTLKLSDDIKSMDERIDMLAKELKKSKDEDIAILKKELKRAEELMISDKTLFEWFFRTTYTKVIGVFFM